jgi:hypothetical protein
MNEKSLAERAAEMRREYKKTWNAANRERCKEHMRRYWEKKALEKLNAAREARQNEEEGGTEIQ